MAYLHYPLTRDDDSQTKKPPEGGRISEKQTFVTKESSKVLTASESCSLAARSGITFAL
jgi:hypothetical protein